MAKWGEGDPRWIVEMRDDGKNVNNWHWTERDVTQWSKDKLTSFLTPLELGSPDHINISIKEVTSLTGEASINNRKGKLLFFFEWTIKLEFKAETEDDVISGYVIISRLSDENTANEIDVDVEEKNDSGELFQLAKEIIRKSERDKFVQVAQAYREALRGDATAGMQYTAKTITQQSTPEPKPKFKDNHQTKAVPTSKPDTTAISLKETFLASSLDIYECFTVAYRVSIYTGRPCEINAMVGGKFSMMGGIITGSFTKLSEGELIEQEWRMNDWPADCVSRLQIKFVPCPEGCQLHLEQKGVPVKSAERTKEGWNSQIFQRIRMAFGYGVSPGMSL